MGTGSGPSIGETSCELVPSDHVLTVTSRRIPDPPLPGPTDRAWWRSRLETPAIARHFEQFPEIKERTIATHAMRRLGTPGEVAEPGVAAPVQSAFVDSAF